MEYIDKSALAAELKKRFDYRVNGLKAIDNGTFWKEGQSEDEFNAVLTRCAYNAVKNEVFELMCFLDTLEAKEVDLDSDIRTYLTNHFNIYEDGVLQSKESGVPLSTYDIIKVAKHFFVLGLKAQKGE